MTTLVRWEPVRELDSLQGEMNRLFDSFFGGGNGNGSSGRASRWMPAMDLVETEDALVLKADLPGLSREDVSIEVKDRVLAISGERKTDHSEEVGDVHRVERSFGSFARTLTLPGRDRREGIAAEFDNGVLEVRIPKPEERKPHRVEIGDRSIEGSAEEK